MQQLPPKRLQVDQLKNKCEDCVHMELEGIPVQQATTGTEQIDLYLTINFDEQREQLAVGSVKFGLKSGELRLRAGKRQNSIQLPWAKIWFTSAFYQKK